MVIDNTFTIEKFWRYEQYDTCIPLILSFNSIIDKCPVRFYNREGEDVLIATIDETLKKITVCGPYEYALLTRFDPNKMMDKIITHFNHSLSGKGKIVTLALDIGDDFKVIYDFESKMVFGGHWFASLHSTKVSTFTSIAVFSEKDRNIYRIHKINDLHEIACINSLSRGFIQTKAEPTAYGKFMAIKLFEKLENIKGPSLSLGNSDRMFEPGSKLLLNNGSLQRLKKLALKKAHIIVGGITSPIEPDEEIETAVESIWSEKDSITMTSILEGDPLPPEDFFFVVLDIKVEGVHFANVCDGVLQLYCDDIVLPGIESTFIHLGPDEYVVYKDGDNGPANNTAIVPWVDPEEISGEED